MEPCKNRIEIRGDELKKLISQKYVNLNPVYSKEKIIDSRIYTVGTRKTIIGGDEITYIDWINSSWLRRYQKPETDKDKKFVSEVLKEYMSDPEYNLEELIMDILYYER